MPDSTSAVHRAFSGAAKIGLSNAMRALAYPLRRAYYEAKFACSPQRGSVLRGLIGMFPQVRASSTNAPHDPQSWQLLGQVHSYRRDGQLVTVRAENAWLQIAVLAADLFRVRLGLSESFDERDSYPVCKDTGKRENVAYALAEDDQAVEVRTANACCRIQRRPCRLSFSTLDGVLIHGDSAGMGWQGRKVARFSSLAEGERIFGLGERACGLDRRGEEFVMWNIDPQVYAPGQDPLYLNVPFYIGMNRGRAHGLFYDNTFRAELDLGKTRTNEASYWAEAGELCYYFFAGPDLPSILRRYTELTGCMPLPPLWALGYHQSRWSYYPQSRVQEIARRFRQLAVPCDAIHLDIHHMQGYRCFTWDKERFPDPEGLISQLHEQGFRLVVIEDCGIKADPHYPICADGLAKGMFCTYPDGSVAAGPVWPGESYFPDFTSPHVREWWGQLNAPLLQIGVDGVWNDMNEPTVIGPKGETLAGCVRHDWEGRGTDHRQAHNVYGMQMVRASAEGLQRLRPHERPFVLTRSGWAGVQRYALSWTADNASTWEHLRLTVPMVLGLGLSGLAFTGADVGGFDGSPTPELLVRWMQLGAFLPFFRNHSALDTADQEPWAHGEPYLTMNRQAIELRYRLLPYLYTATWQCSQTGAPIVRPLCWAWPNDLRCASVEDEFLCGDALLVAPVGLPGATSRMVYLPEGNWYDFWSDESHLGPVELEVAAPLERIPLFVRAGSVLPTWPVMQHTPAGSAEELALHIYPGHGESWLYQDDGHSTSYTRGEFLVTRFVCRQAQDRLLSVTSASTGRSTPGYVRWEWNVHGLSGEPASLLADGVPVPDPAWSAASRLLRFATRPFSGIEVQVA